MICNLCFWANCVLAALCVASGALSALVNDAVFAVAFTVLAIPCAFMAGRLFQRKADA